MIVEGTNSNSIGLLYSSDRAVLRIEFAASMATEPKTARPGEMSRDDILGVAIESAVQAFVVIILGEVAISIVGGIAEDMLPSAPPGFERAESTGHWSAWKGFFSTNLFWIVFGVLFVAGLRQRFFPRTAAAGRKPSRWQRISQRASEHWFGSLITNAFIAMGLSIALAAIPSLSVWHWFWNAVSGFLNHLVASAFGESSASRFNAWLDWYGNNLLKFNFWLIFVGGVCDDLGIPNYKSLWRWFWRRRAKSDQPKVIETTTSVNAANESEHE